MMYNTSNNYYSVPFYGNPNNEINNYNSYQIPNTQRKKPSHSSIYNTTYPCTASDYPSENGARNICINVNGAKKSNDSRKGQCNAMSDGSENNYYATEKRRCGSACHSFSKRPNKINCKNCCEHDEENSEGEHAIHMNNLNGNNNYSVSYNSNEKIKNERKKQKEQMIHINYEDDEEEEENKCQCGRMNEDWNCSKELDMDNMEANGGRTYININVDGGFGEANDYYDGTEEEYKNEYINGGFGAAYFNGNARGQNNQYRKKRNRKLFMGKYYLSELKQTLMTPLHACGPHPTLVVPNPNLLCYGIAQKQSEMRRKPELVVRY